MDQSKMTKAQLIAELERVRTEARSAPCGCCGMTPKEWDETPLLDGLDDAPTNEPQAVFIPTCWVTSNEIEEPDYQEDDE